MRPAPQGCAFLGLRFPGKGAVPALGITYLTNFLIQWLFLNSEESNGSKTTMYQSGFCYHIMLRGIGGQDIFRDDADRARFCLLVQYASEKHQLNIHAFCLMRNHVHFVIQPITSDLSAGIHALAFRYAQHFNKKYKRRGYLYQGRYKAVLVQSGSYLQRLVRYVHLNPVRAAIVKNPEDYNWSSYRSYTGAADYVWLNQGLVIDVFGRQSGDGAERLTNYTQMNNEEAYEEALEIRKSLRRGAYGDNEFLEKWRPLLSEEKVQADLQSLGANEVTIEKIVEIVCNHLGTSIESIRSDKRTSQFVLARALMAQVTQKLSAGSMAALGRYISRDSTSLAKLARKGKDDPQVQALKNELLKVLIAPYN